MRLMRRLADGELVITKDIPADELHDYPYAILSHTWLENNNNEVTFQDFEQRTQKSKVVGYAKIQFCADQAKQDHLEYFWVDTCCIDKRNSEELREAITSMFAWYRNAVKCYAYLIDVSFAGASDAETRSCLPLRSWESAFRASRWFTRGWTLQELLAPTSVEFFSGEGTRLGSKRSLEDCIFEITGIPRPALRGAHLSTFTVEERYLWSQGRLTKRKEDRAYCLLGIFNVFIPHNYGEGDYAFDRLREAIESKQAETARQNEILATLPRATGAAFNSRNNEHAPRCHPNTRVEVLQDINRWISTCNDKCICWLNGMAGTGKSTIARTIAKKYHDQGKLGASFFFSKGSGDLSNANKFVTSLSEQIASSIPAARRYICEAITDHKTLPEQSLREQWEHLILRPLSQLDANSCPTPLVLVVDALDECDNEQDIKDILRVLASAKSMQNIRLRIFLSGRPELPVRHAFKSIPEAERHMFILHEVPTSLVNRDIKLYFQSQFSIIRKERRFTDEWPGDRNINMLVESACGLFIWASVACRFLREGRLSSSRRIAMLLGGHQSRADPERQLDHIYVTVLRNAIPPGSNQLETTEHLTLLRETLGRIVVLRSALSMTSLAALLNRSTTDVQDTLAKFHTIFRISARTSDPIHLHHPTFRDFLLDKDRCSGLSLWADEKRMHGALADSCIEYMSKALESYVSDIDDCRTPPITGSRPEATQRNEHALRYAGLYWVEHYRRSNIHLRDGDRVHLFLQNKFLAWFEAMKQLGKSAEVGAIIRLYHSLLTPADNTRQIPLVKIARRFLVTYQSSIRRASVQSHYEGPASIDRFMKLRQQRSTQTPQDTQGGMIDTLRFKAQDESNYVNDLAFTPDGKQIVSGSRTEIVRLWDVATGSALCKLDGALKEKVSSVAISTDGDLMAAGSDDFTVAIWSFHRQTVLFAVKGHSGWVNSVVFSPDGKTLVSGSMDETIILWDTATGKEIKRFGTHASGVNSLAFSSDGSLIASGSVDGIVRLWKVSDRPGCLPIILDGDGGCVNSVKFSPDGKRVLSGSDDMAVRLWEWDTLTTPECAAFRGHSKKVVAVTFSPDASYIVSGSEDMTIRIWNASTGDTLRTLRGHTSGINAVAFSPNGVLLASGSFDDEVRLWHTNDWSLKGALDEFEEDTLETGVEPIDSDWIGQILDIR